MLKFSEVEKFSIADRASHDYYQASLKGASGVKLRRLRQIWMCALQNRWPELIGMGLCVRCIARDTDVCEMRARRFHMIAEAAYYRAAQRGFQGGNPEQDWLEAEREIDRRYFFQ
jgi:hypothetical protein